MCGGEPGGGERPGHGRFEQGIWNEACAAEQISRSHPSSLCAPRSTRKQLPGPSTSQKTELHMNYVDRDPHGMYKATSSNAPDKDGRRGPGPELMGANTLVGNDVYNLKQEDLGDIKDIMLDMRTGRVSYAVVAFGGFLGMGEKFFAVPWQALKLDTENKRFTLDTDRERLEKAPGFDKDNWPNMSDISWQRDIHSYYGTKPYDDTRLS